MKKLLSLLMVLALCLGMITTVSAVDTAAAGEFDAQLRLEAVDWTKSEDGSYYSAKVEYCVNVTNEELQYMNVFVPAAYVEGGDVNGYTADTAPIVLMNNCMGWNSSTPGDVVPGYIASGFVFVNCGARSRDDANGKAPTPVVDLKSAVRTLRLNADLIPGDEERIVSIGTSGGGQMSSILGASGNMEEYYSYLYANGAAGIAKEGDAYVSTIDDDIYAAQCYCPITDLANGDIAYAWMRYNAGDTAWVGMFGPGGELDALQQELHGNLAEAYVEYINSLNIKGLKLDGVREGSYYDQILANISDAFNTFVKNQEFPYSIMLGFGPTATTLTYNSMDELMATYTNTESWLVQNEDGTYAITDLDEFVKGTSLPRNKNIPGYDPMDRSEENNAFGTADQAAVHYSASVAAVMADMLEKGSENLTDDYKAIFNDYITEANADYVKNQVYLMNSTQILLETAAGKQDADFAEHWRIRSGTADEHASFSVGYNLAMAAEMAGANADYSLVWGMVHGDGEGTTTGTFVDWVKEICPVEEETPVVDNNIYYTEEQSQFQTIQVYLPEGEAPEGGWPVAVYVPGGGFNVCANVPSEYHMGALENGIALIAVNYRAPINFSDILAGSMPPGNGGIPAELTDRTEIAMEMANDVKAALRYITANAEELGVNADEILLLGDSAGGGLSSYVTYGQEDFEGFSIAACAGWAPANHDVWTDADWSRTAASADEKDAPYYLLTGTHDKVCTADDRAVGFVNLMLDKGVNVSFTLIPDALHMDDISNPDNFYDRSIALGMEDLVWDWFKTVLDGTLEDAPDAYELTYDIAFEELPEASAHEMEGKQPLVEAVDESPKTADNAQPVMALAIAAAAVLLLCRVRKSAKAN